MKAAPANPQARRWVRRKEARPAELLSAALELFVERCFAGTRLDDVAARAEVESFEGGSRDLLHRLIHGWWSEYGASPAGGLTKLMLAESGNFPAITRFFVEEAIEPWYQLATGVIRSGIGRGEFRPVDVEAFVEVLTASMVMLSVWTRSFGPFASRPMDATRFIDTLFDMALCTLTNGPRPGSTAGARVRS